jgi:hypothetical protein
VGWPAPVTNPCLASGFLSNYTSVNSKTGQYVMFAGSSNYDACVAAVKTLFQ